jgi:hypothetical protein
VLERIKEQQLLKEQVLKAEERKKLEAAIERERGTLKEQEQMEELYRKIREEEELLKRMKEGQPARTFSRNQEESGLHRSQNFAAGAS